MTLQGEHIVLKCSSDECGMRYPSPADDPRRDHCPLCDAPTTKVGVFADPPAHSGAEPNAQRIVVVFDSIRSAQNVGMMLRSADGAGLQHVYLCGLTAKPDNPKVQKTSLGADQTVATTWLPDVVECVHHLRSEGFSIWAVDATQRSVALETVTSLHEPIALVMGNETAGVDPEVLHLADRHVHLTMRGAKSTVNVGVAMGTISYWLASLPA